MIDSASGSSPRATNPWKDTHVATKTDDQSYNHQANYKNDSSQNSVNRRRKLYCSCFLCRICEYEYVNDLILEDSDSRIYSLFGKALVK
jgi:hypothetical protein